MLRGPVTIRMRIKRRLYGANGKIAGFLPIVSQGTEWASTTGYKGKALQIQFTVQDEHVFTRPWSATTTYWRASGAWTERACAENMNAYYAGQNSSVPTAKQPDF